MAIELGIPQLSSNQIEELCSIAEESAEKHILSKVNLKQIEMLNISVETEGTLPVRITVDVELRLSRSLRKFDVRALASQAVRKAFVSAEDYLERLRCLSKK